MKALYLLIIGISLMAQQITPYPYPNYDDDLMAKELVNGTYIASIDMMMRNSQTGEERYSYVPDTPIIEDMEHGVQVKKINEQSLDTTTKVYDRDKSLEDAVLPKYVEVGNIEPEIVSRAMCPQNILYEGELKISGSDNMNAMLKDSFVTVEEIDDTSSSLSNVDVWKFWRVRGLEKEYMFELTRDTIESLTWIVARNDRLFVRVYTNEHENILYEVINNALVEIDRDIGWYKIILEDKGRYYTVHNKIINDEKYMIFKNIDNGYIAKLKEDGSGSYIHENIHTNSFIDNGRIYKISDGVASRVTTKKPSEIARARLRFDYWSGTSFLTYPTKYNDKRGISDYPKAKISNNGDYMGSVREAYVVASGGVNNVSFDTLWYTRDYKNYIDTGIEIGRGDIGVTEDYIYIKHGTKLIVASVTEWGYKLPSGRYAELFNRNGMKQGIYDNPYIGD